MPATETKQKILDASLVLFNSKGIANVRLQDIADETEISTGNLAYHFEKKEIIADALIEQSVGSLQAILQNYGQFASLRDLDAFFKEFYQYCGFFKFLFYDALEIKRTYPESYEPLQSLFTKLRLQVERRLELYRKQKLLLPDLAIKAIASNLWVILFFMNSDGELMSKRAISETIYRSRLWDHIAHYFTARGHTEFASTVEQDLKNR